jgi:multiple sugar transport system ATP-binding protein
VASVTLENLCKVFAGGVHAVKDLNLHIENGEFVVLLGPSGCGKTTTLQIIAGLERQSSGAILFDTERVDLLPTHERDIAMVFQSYALYPNMKVYDNMAFGLKIRKTPKSEIERRVNEAAQILGISELLLRRPAQLSGGQRQRVALGRAIVRDPRVFLLDEPLSNVDAKLRGQMRFELKALHQRLGSTFIYVTHDQVEAMSMGDRIAIMMEGVLQQYDTPTAIYHSPANLFVATFIGNPIMNVFPGALVSGQQSEFTGASFTYRWHTISWPDMKARPVTLGIRPTDVKLSLRASGNHQIAAPVELQEPLGSDLFLSLRMGDERMVVRADPDFEVQTGDMVYIHVPETRVHVFDSKTGERLTPAESRVTVP